MGNEKIMLEMSVVKPYVFLVILVVATILVWNMVFASEGTGKLTVTFFDVGQGDAIFIETPNGIQMLVDGGKGRAVLRELGQRMKFADHGIDVVLATHPDYDHIGGLPAVFDRFDVGMYLNSGVQDGGADNRALQVAVQREGILPVVVRAGMELILDEGVRLEILAPTVTISNIEANRGSIVARLVYGETEFLLTGDAPAGVEVYLALLHEEALQSDVIKLGHHGSRTSTSDLLLGYADPDYAVVSAGCNNEYGHPHDEVLKRVARFESNIVSTCENGTITFQSDGKNLTMLP